MNRFVCKNCGMITDKPEIEVLGVSVNGDPSACYKITCPVCLGITKFIRPEPFPTDKEDNINLSTIPSRVI